MSHTFDVCIVGLGPAGLAAALRLASARDTSLLCVESGPSAEARYCSILEEVGCRWAHPCEMISGVGGASLLSGGKLSLYPAGRSMEPLVGGRSRTRDLLTQALDALREYVPLVAPVTCTRSIDEAAARFAESGFCFRHYESYRYNRSDLVKGFTRMCANIVRHGHDVRLGTTVEDVRRGEDAFLVTLRTGSRTETVATSRLVLATGRSGTELLSKVATHLAPVQHLGRYDVGVRLEFPHEYWPEIADHHNDLKLEFGDARTFCVCTDGALAPYRVGEHFFLEGYSDPGLSTGLTNLGIVLRIAEGDPEFLPGILHRLSALSDGRPIRESLDTYLGTAPPSRADFPSSITFWEPGSVSMCYPEPLASRIRNAVHKFTHTFLSSQDRHHVAVFAPEIDYYWPTIPVDANFRTAVNGLFLIGDATTRFRGILQAFASGLHIASALSRDLRRAA